MSIEAMKLAQDLRELADRFSEGWHDGIKIDASDIVLLAMAAFAIEQAEQAQPVAVYGHCPECGAKGVLRERRPNGNDKCANGHTYPSASAIKTSPPPRQPLTDEQIDRTASPYLQRIFGTTRIYLDVFREFARAIEAANGIKGNT